MNQQRGIAGLAGLAGLVEGVRPAQSEQARVAAMKELLDRGHGRPPQAGPLQSSRAHMQTTSS
jgi:hypothetical protein